MSYAVITPSGFSTGEKYLRRMPGLYGLGQTETITPPVLLNPNNPSGSLITPGSSLWNTIKDTIYNSATGDLTQDQVNQLVQQESSELQQAGMSASDAQQQAQSDVNETIQSFCGSGALGVSWCGAGPGDTGFPSAWCQADSLGLGLSNCTYLLIAGAGALALWFFGKKLG